MGWKYEAKVVMRQQYGIYCTMCKKLDMTPVPYCNFTTNHLVEIKNKKKEQDDKFRAKIKQYNGRDYHQVNPGDKAYWGPIMVGDFQFDISKHKILCVHGTGSFYLKGDVNMSDEQIIKKFDSVPISKTENTDFVICTNKQYSTSVRRNES